ncbi:MULTISPECIES: SigB/SigF/SigG family RNA polymerase sigma factor [unclassified Streptomyces]|uniref:SigB/SigF/SigG family RNA polymerase sigma factor n=1 Tax=unclassified Streptomyces TaxID=2593676 RepID=UPI002E18EC11|nr:MULTISPECIES: SigB/SigF/SigG family RNA polymerase sigma factor [unclassified Streptomyces]
MTSRHSHHDAPDTAEIFTRFAACAPGREHDLLRSELVEAWLPMAHRIASRFRGRGENLDDLKQVAALGLLKSVQRFDPTRGAFESYAVPTITGEVRRYFRDHAWDVRVPRPIQDLRNKVRAACRELAQQPGHGGGEPSVGEMAAQAGLSPDQVRTGLAAMESYSALSLDADNTRAGNGVSITDTLGVPEPGYDLIADREAAKEGLRDLPERERTILFLYFFEGMSQTSIAAQVGVSQMQISRLITKSCGEVRNRAA